MYYPAEVGVLTFIDLIYSKNSYSIESSEIRFFIYPYTSFSICQSHELCTSELHIWTKDPRYEGLEGPD